ncbi:MAG: hypothetical protein OWR52_10920 [Acidibacillus sp.]|uniref:Uncharacterized protein n=1 Tax=Sulfoacidibacillus ferrooxidans TaxID=2005001 RepID=A0A9X1V7X2_9BACL|nr:hypothetical protein [Sulfoacidibacillus ferrooxidans]MCI0183316.1 hypothetical protein [Sulfoacidibacillus ferrooxidans]MCY0894005.1 hypothetical protein [Acidibacillus sp.]
MPKNVKRSAAPKRQAKSRKPAAAADKARMTAIQSQTTGASTPPSAINPATGTPTGSLDALKDNIKRMDKHNLFDALKRVKEMKPEQWKDPDVVRDLTQNLAQDIGVKVDPRRIDAFMNAYSDVTKNAGEKGPNVSVEEIAKKYGGSNVDEKTIKEIKKFVK